jgi:hypothetical protein
MSRESLCVKPFKGDKIIRSSKRARKSNSGSTRGFPTGTRRPLPAMRVPVSYSRHVILGERNGTSRSFLSASMIACLLHEFRSV